MNQAQLIDSETGKRIPIFDARHHYLGEGLKASRRLIEQAKLGEGGMTLRSSDERHQAPTEKPVSNYKQRQSGIASANRHNLRLKGTPE